MIQPLEQILTETASPKRWTSLSPFLFTEIFKEKKGKKKIPLMSPADKIINHTL